MIYPWSSASKGHQWVLNPSTRPASEPLITRPNFRFHVPWSFTVWITSPPIFTFVKEWVNFSSLDHLWVCKQPPAWGKSPVIYFNSIVLPHCWRKSQNLGKRFHHKDNLSSERAPRAAEYYWHLLAGGPAQYVPQICQHLSGSPALPLQD